MRRINEATSKTCVSASLKSQLTRCVKMPITMSRRWNSCKKTLNHGKKSTRWKLKKRNFIISKLLMLKGRISSSRLPLEGSKMTLKIVSVTQMTHPWLKKRKRRTLIPSWLALMWKTKEIKISILKVLQTVRRWSSRICWRMPKLTEDAESIRASNQVEPHLSTQTRIREPNHKVCHLRLADIEIFQLKTSSFSNL